MKTDNVPDIYLNKRKDQIDLFLYDFKMTEDVIKTKVNLNMHMFSFLQEGKKQVHFADVSVAVNNEQSLLLKKGNCLWTELLDNEKNYFCRLLFFSDKRIREFLNTHTNGIADGVKSSYFIIENDNYINSYLDSLSSIMSASTELMECLLTVKFDELMLYLINKYGTPFEAFLYSLISIKTSNFQQIIGQNLYTSLSLEEIAFLCNMSLSTFKRHFEKEYHQSQGKWFRDKRLLHAKEILENGALRSSDIYQELGYNNLTNFSAAFKNKFGYSPRQAAKH